MEEMYTVKEVAKFLKVKETTIRARIKKDISRLQKLCLVIE